MIQITLITRSPVHLAGTFAVGPLATTLGSIPGRSVRGALAGLHRQYDSEFAARFLDPRNWFGPLMPVGTPYTTYQQVLMLPATARTCKLNPGFKEDGGHGVRDALFELLKDIADPAAETCASEDCDAKLVPQTGYYGTVGNKTRGSDSNRRLVTKTAIDSRRETSAPAQLYSRQVIEEGQKFSGFFSVADPAQEGALAAMLTEERRFYLGGGRSRGFGQVEVVEVETQNVNEWLPSGDLVERLEKFDELARSAGVLCSRQTIFSITLRSEAVIYDRYLRPEHKITPEYLGHYIDPRMAVAEPLGSFVKTRIIEGWNDAHRLPRDAVVAIDPSSVFAYGIDMAPADLAPLLVSLERVGLGDNRVEGFGRVIINHPFHQQEDMI